MVAPHKPRATGSDGDKFPPTRWSLILNACGPQDEALRWLCSAYWYPLYAFARRSGLSQADAEDLTQAFFAHWIANDLLTQARRERGRLRSFLLRAFRNFSVGEWRKRVAQKRGGNQTPIEFDALSAEERFALEPRHEVTPEIEFDRAWARELLRRTLTQLREEYDRSGKRTLFEALKDQIADGASPASYESLAAKLRSTEGALRVAAFKLRQRYRTLLRQSVADTVADEDEVDEELTHLRLIFGA
ncbi:MAG: sigma-70 family RNA polymerase sigma factor [Verrucomicrobiales bacterium]|nr:sigma-70 family RNA polymerase sigma factor [Verrucomicrobiales bacterium]